MMTREELIEKYNELLEKNIHITNEHKISNEAIWINVGKDMMIREFLQDLSTLREEKDNVVEMKTTLTDRINQAQNNAEIWTAIWELHDEIIRQNIG